MAIKVPQEVKDAGLAKWIKPLEIGPDFEALRDWWHDAGWFSCSFCAHLDIAEGFPDCEGNCPLYDGTGQCAEPWNKLSKRVQTAEQFLALAREMYDLIDNVEVE